MSVDSLDPRFVTVLADVDGFCRWVVRVNNYDVPKPVDVLIVLHPDGTVELATRPPTAPDATWAPPFIAQRR